LRQIVAPGKTVGPAAIARGELPFGFRRQAALGPATEGERLVKRNMHHRGKDLDGNPSVEAAQVPAAFFASPVAWCLQACFLPPLPAFVGPQVAAAVAP